MGRSRALTGKELAAHNKYQAFAVHLSFNGCAACRTATEKFNALVAASCKPGAPKITEEQREAYVASCCETAAVVLREAHALSAEIEAAKEKRNRAALRRAGIVK